MIEGYEDEICYRCKESFTGAEWFDRHEVDVTTDYRFPDLKVCHADCCPDCVVVS